MVEIEELSRIQPFETDQPTCSESQGFFTRIGTNLISRDPSAASACKLFMVDMQTFHGGQGDLELGIRNGRRNKRPNQFYSKILT